MNFTIWQKLIKNSLIPGTAIDNLNKTSRRDESLFNGH